MDNCSTVEITRITEQVKDLAAIFAASQDRSDSDRTIIIDSDVFDTITTDLASATDKNDTSILPLDLQNSINTVEAILRFICECVSMHNYTELYKYTVKYIASYIVSITCIMCLNIFEK